MIEIKVGDKNVVEVKGSGKNEIDINNNIILKPTLSGQIGYLRSELSSGQTISVYDYDEGYRFQRGEFNDKGVIGAEYIQRKDYYSLDPHRILKYNNKYGNKNRFTALDGTQNYIEVPCPLIANNIGMLFYILIVDNLYDVAYIFNKVGVKTYGESILDGFNSSRTYIALGITDWRVVSIRQMRSLLYMNSLNNEIGFDYDPLNFYSIGGVMGSGTVYNDNNFYYQSTSGYTTYTYHKSGEYGFMICKNLD